MKAFISFHDEPDTVIKDPKVVELWLVKDVESKQGLRLAYFMAEDVQSVQNLRKVRVLAEVFLNTLLKALPNVPSEYKTDPINLSLMNGLLTPDSEIEWDAENSQEIITFLSKL
jgi:hypothetical protein